jgi:hypothetical protein
MEEGTVTAIATELIRIARSIGRWILERLLKVAGRRLGYYMLERAEVFARRLKRAKAERRKKWLRGRIARWKKAGAWLITWAEDVSKCIANEADALAAKAAGLPLQAKCERLGAA